MTWLGAVLQKGSDLGFLLGHGEGKQVTHLRFTEILEKDEEGRSRCRDIRRFMQWRDKLHGETGLGRRVLTTVP